MRFRSYAMSFLALTIVFGAVGCGSPSDPKAQEDRLVHLIDDQQYQEVIDLFASEEEADDLKPFRAYLAEAYLGLAGFEPVKLAAKITGPQENVPAELEALIPGCPAGVLSRTATPPIRCLSKRLFMNLPSADDPNFAKGRKLLLELFSDVDTAPRKYNTLIAAVQAASAFRRAGQVLVQYNGIDPEIAEAKDLQPLFDQLSLLAVEADQSLARARRSPWVVSRYLTGLENSQLSSQGPGGLSYVPGTGIPQLISLLEQSDDLKSKIVKAMVLQRIDGIVEELKNSSL